MVVGCCCMGDFFPKRSTTVTTTTQQVSHQNPTRGSTREIRWHNALAAFFDQTRTKQGRRSRSRNIWRYIYIYTSIKLRHGLQEKVQVERTRNTSVLPCARVLYHAVNKLIILISFSCWKIKIFEKILRFVDYIRVL